jgi:hypothetical protein
MNCKRLGSGDMSTAAALERSSSDRHAQLAAAACNELVLGDVIGAGGYGSVWRGSWKQVTAAIKVSRTWRARWAGGRWMQCMRPQKGCVHASPH